MKLALAASAILLVVLVSVAEAYPEGNVANGLGSTFDEPKVEYVAPEGRSDRHRRVTCDLLSFETKWGSINHAACAAHCLALLRGYRGGHCDSNGVCICRK